MLDKLSFAFEDLGALQVKNIARPIEAYRVQLGLLQQESPKLADHPRMPVYRVYNGRFADGGATRDRVAGATSQDLYAVTFANAAHGVAVGTGRILETFDGGVSWIDRAPAFSGDLYGVAMQGSIANSWAVGQNGMVFRR